LDVEIVGFGGVGRGNEVVNIRHWNFRSDVVEMDSRKRDCPVAIGHDVARVDLIRIVKR